MKKKTGRFINANSEKKETHYKEFQNKYANTYNQKQKYLNLALLKQAEIEKIYGSMMDYYIK